MVDLHFTSQITETNDRHPTLYDDAFGDGPVPATPHMGGQTWGKQSELGKPLGRDT